MSRHLLAWIIIFSASLAHAQSIKGLPSLPTRGAGFQGSVGVGFTDLTTNSPSQDFKLDRGTFVTTQLERTFDFMHLYLTLGLGYMDASGTANYNYTNLSSSATYTLSDVGFRAQSYELSLGLKGKIIEDYWFRPYIEGGGIGSYNEVTYGSKLNALTATGTDYKTKDVIMGSGYYGEGGVEIQFTDRFGLKLAARRSIVETKALDTLGKQALKLTKETYYLSLLIGL